MLEQRGLDRASGGNICLFVYIVERRSEAHLTASL